METIERNIYKRKDNCYVIKAGKTTHSFTTLEKAIAARNEEDQKREKLKQKKASITADCNDDYLKLEYPENVYNSWNWLSIEQRIYLHSNFDVNFKTLYDLNYISKQEYEIVINVYKLGKTFSDVGASYGWSRQRTQIFVKRFFYKISQSREMSYILLNNYDIYKAKSDLENLCMKYKLKIKEIMDEIENRETNTTINYISDNPCFSPRTLHSLTKYNITTIQQLASLTEEELSKMRGLGKKCIDEIKRVLITYGYTLKDF